MSGGMNELISRKEYIDNEGYLPAAVSNLLRVETFYQDRGISKDKLTLEELRLSPKSQITSDFTVTVPLGKITANFIFKKSVMENEDGTIYEYAEKGFVNIEMLPITEETLFFEIKLRIQNVLKKL